VYKVWNTYLGSVEDQQSVHEFTATRVVMVEIDQQVLEDLYSWIDQIPLSRPKKDLKRDFSDGGIT